MHMIRLNKTAAGGLQYGAGALLFFLLLAPATARAAEDNYEENDLRTTAYNLTSHEDKDLSLLDGPGYYNDADWYKFEVGASATLLEVYLTYTHTVSSNIDLFLYDSAGGYLADTRVQSPQGTEAIFWDTNDGLTGGIYYVKVNGVPDIGTEYELKWDDDDDEQVPPEVSAPDPADGANVAEGPSGQVLQVTAPDTDTCTIHYGTDTGTPVSVAGTVNGDYCETTVAYGADMLSDGTNYWYVEAANPAGTTRYPGSGTLSFTVSPTPQITAPDPADGAKVSAGASGQLLRVQVADADQCSIYYSADGTTFPGPDVVTPSGGYCETTVPYGTHMNSEGTNYWYVEAENTVASARFPETNGEYLSFTVSRRPRSMPWLMLLLKGEEGAGPPAPQKGKSMPWLMLLLNN